MTETLTWMAGNPVKAAATIGVVIVFGLVAWFVQTMIERKK